MSQESTSAVLKPTAIALAVSATLGITAMSPASAVGLANGVYEMVINNTTYSGGSYSFGTDGNWNSSFTFGCIPSNPPGCGWSAMYDDTIATPVNGRYGGVPNDGVQGTVLIEVNNGNITGNTRFGSRFEFDTLVNTAGDDFAQYGDSVSFTGSIDSAGNISLTPTGVLGALELLPAVVDARWNVDNYNGTSTGGGTNFAVNPPTANTTYDTFSTGTATNSNGSINGAVYDGTRAILVKAGTLGSDWGAFFGVTYFEVWNVSFNPVVIDPVPVPASLWLFGSGLFAFFGIKRRRGRRLPVV